MDRNFTGHGQRLDDNLGQYRDRLLQKKERIRQGIRSIKENTFSESAKINVGEFSSYDQHSADMALETFERGKDLGLKDGLAIQGRRVDLALERLDKGTYGWCLRCKRPISEGRLRAMPDAELCLECQEEQEVLPTNRRPVEEGIVNPYMRGIETITDDPYATGSAQRQKNRFLNNVFRPRVDR